MLVIFNIIALVFCGFMFYKLEKVFKAFLDIMSVTSPIDNDFWEDKECEEKI